MGSEKKKDNPTEDVNINKLNDYIRNIARAVAIHKVCIKALDC